MGEGMGDKGPMCAQTGRESSAGETQLVCRESPAWALGIAGLLAACPPVPGDRAAGDGQHQPRAV